MSILSKNQIISYLRDDSKEEELYSRARAVRERMFGDKVFLYGFVYFSTFCRNNCNFCYFRRGNEIERYRKSKEEVTELAEQLVKSGVNLIDLTMGEDALYHAEEFKSVLDIIRQLKDDLNIPVMISPGVVQKKLIDKFAEVGTEWYALYQETHNRELFEKLRVEQSYDERMNSKLYAKTRGMLIEEGLMSGVGESLEDLADSLLTMGEIGAAQVRVMSFVPQEGSPMEHMPTPDRSLEFKLIALMRILYPHVLIPASLDIDGIKGLKSRVDAGANVVTSIIPPKTGLLGVAQSKMDVDDGGRTVAEVEPILKSMGLRPAETSEYVEYLARLKEMCGVA